MLCDSFPDVLEVHLQGATVDDTDTDLEFEMIDGAGEPQRISTACSDLGLYSRLPQPSCCLFDSHAEAEGCFIATRGSHVCSGSRRRACSPSHCLPCEQTVRGQQAWLLVASRDI